jgi:hypothetical protein
MLIYLQANLYKQSMLTYLWERQNWPLEIIIKDLKDQLRPTKDINEAINAYVFGYKDWNDYVNK